MRGAGDLNLSLPLGNLLLWFFFSTFLKYCNFFTVAYGWVKVARLHVPQFDFCSENSMFVEKTFLYSLKSNPQL